MRISLGVFLVMLLLLAWVWQAFGLWPMVGVALLISLFGA